VLEPAPLRVTNLSSRRTDDGVRVTATVTNRFQRPGEGTVSLRLDGQEVASERFSLGPGEAATLAATRSLSGPGTYEFTAGNATLRLTVEGGQGNATGRTPGVDAPGFGPGLALVAVLAGLLLAHRVQ
jgi:PGF-CTERM protein